MPPPPETDEEERREAMERQLAELKARQGRLELGLGGALLVLLAVVVWAVFFRESPHPVGRPSALLLGPAIPAAAKLT